MAFLDLINLGLMMLFWLCLSKFDWVRVFEIIRKWLQLLGLRMLLGSRKLFGLVICRKSFVVVYNRLLFNERNER